MKTVPAMLTVTQLNSYIKSLLDGDPRLSCVFVTGEISNFTNHYKSGHFYLSLKDEKGVIKAVMFASQASRVRFLPEDGMKVLVRGRVSVYEATGQYQLYIDDLQPDGLGAFNLAFEQMKKKLEAEGLFDPSRKKTLPRFPERIGVITSPTGAAIHDIQQVLGRRYPMAELIFAPVLVQGEGAAPQLAQALETFNRERCADVIILGRGGGSLEDLWPFNEEVVARAVAASSIPVISAVGHETDFTICDFVADLRAPTPSAAAELAAPDQEELLGLLNGYQYAMGQAVSMKMMRYREQFAQAGYSRFLIHPEEMVSVRRIQVDDLSQRLALRTHQSLRSAQTEAASLSGRLDALSPLKVLGRGYAFASNAEGKALADIRKITVGDEIQVRMRNGVLDCTVNAVNQLTEENQGGE